MTSTKRKYIKAIHAFFVTALLICISACSNDDSDSSSSLNEAYWKISSTVSLDEGSSAIIITGKPGTEWNAEITEGESWFSFSSTDYVGATTKKGVIKDGLNVLYVYYKKNQQEEERTASLSFAFLGEAPQTFDLTQLSGNEPVIPSNIGWPELPVNKEQPNYQYATHFATLNSKRVRNYSICFDKNSKAALWVAYPLHNAYLEKKTNRTDAWAFDPKILPTSFQPDCIKRSYQGNYDRGHQLPSADRLASRELNAQTFYMSNMTPQLDRLNQDMWANLETRVRANTCSDTLYVVTGAYFGNSNKTTKDGAGKTVPLPTHYFKVLLRTKAGSLGKPIKDCSDSELISQGFWVEHRSYGKVQPPAEICMSVAQIEAETGFSFFPQVSATVKQQNNPRQWGIN